MENFKLIVDTFGKDKVKQNQPLSEYTTLKNQGWADLFFIAFTQHELIRMVTLCRQLKIPLMVFGTGSKIIISGDGFKGMMIKNRTGNVKIVSIKGKVSKEGVGVDLALVEVDAGLSIKSFCEFLDKQGLVSEEFNGLPGSIGGNIFLNKNLQDRVEKIKVLNEDDEIETIKSSQLKLHNQIVLSVVLKIKAKV